MPGQQGYTGLSDFFNTPAGRALMSMGQAPPQAAAPRGGSPDAAFFPYMRSGLRGALADAYGEDALRVLRNRQPTVFHRGASGIRGRDNGWIDGPDTEVFDPEHDAPIVAGENSRRQAMLNADSLTALSSMYAPMQAETNQQMLDIGAEGDSYRFWKYDDPIETMRHSRSVDLANVRGQAATLDDVIRTRGAENVATIRADAARKPPAEIVAGLLARLSSSGAFGRDRDGRPMAPPAGVSDAVMQELNGLLFGGAPGAGGQPTTPGQNPSAAPRPQTSPAPASGAPAGGRRRISRQQIAAAVNAGEVRSIEEGIQQAQAAGYEVY